MTQLSPAAESYLRHVNETLGTPWGWKLGLEMSDNPEIMDPERGVFIHSIDGEPCLQAPVQTMAKAARPRRQERFTI